MRVEYFGNGTPEIAVIAGIHGDEPAGVEAIETILAEKPTFEKPVVFIIANERAIEADERYIEEDLNRTFPGDQDGDTHEAVLAAEIVSIVEDCTVLSLHTTQSYHEMFALVKGVDDFARDICPQLSVNAVVDVGDYDTGRLFEAIPRTIEIECGYQGSDQAAENATTVVREFLGAVGALPEEKRRKQRNLPLYRLERPVPKDGATTYEVYVSNFKAVEAGEPFAAIDNEEIVADEGFYPVLMSPYGYENLFGYAAERIGSVEPPEKTDSE